MQLGLLLRRTAATSNCLLLAAQTSCSGSKHFVSLQFPFKFLCFKPVTGDLCRLAWALPIRFVCVQTKAVVSSPVFYAAGSLLYLAALVLWGREGLLGAIWGACREYFADGQVLHL